MRSTNLILFLILLNASAGIVSAVSPTAVNPSTGGSEIIVNTQGNLTERQTNQPSSEEITGSFFGVGDLIQTIDNILFSGPNMLQRMGMPSLFVGGFKTVVIFVASFDVAEAITGRELS